MWSPDLISQHIDTVTTRLLVAAALAGFIGLEREIKRHPAGLRTHILVGVGSCLMMILSLFGFESFIGVDVSIRFDPARIPSYVISGIGFLGAGTILVHGRTVRGLTTAASIWVVAGIGLVAGVGMYYEAILATVIVMLSLFFLNKIEALYVRKQNNQRLTVVTNDEDINLNQLTAIFREMNVQIEKLSIEKMKKKKETLFQYTFLCSFQNNHSLEQTIDRLQKLKQVVRVGKE